MDTIVFYHHNCPDGFSSAWVAWKKFKNNAEYRWLDYHAPFNYNFQGKTIYFLDVVPQEVDFSRLLKLNRVIVIDHHVSSEKMIQKATEAIFSSRHCAAVLTWRYFFPKKQMPLLLKYVEDLDLWQFRQSSSQEINAAIGLMDFDFKQWDKLARQLNTKEGRIECKKKGKIILQYQDKMINKIIGRARPVILAGQEGLMVNSSVLVSKIGNALVQHDYPMAIIWFETKNKRKVSLRSNGDVNVAKIAEKFGGGGHEAAAGFVLSINDPVPWKNL